MYIVLHVPALCRWRHWWQQCLLCVLEIISQFTINIILNLLRKQTAFITTPPHPRPPLALCSLHNVVLVTRLSCRHVTKQVVFIAALIIIHMERARGKQVGRYRSRQLMIQVIFWFIISLQTNETDSRHFSLVQIVFLQAVTAGGCVLQINNWCGVITVSSSSSAVAACVWSSSQSSPSITLCLPRVWCLGPQYRRLLYTAQIVFLAPAPSSINIHQYGTAVPSSQPPGRV